MAGGAALHVVRRGVRRDWRPGRRVCGAAPPNPAGASAGQDQHTTADLNRGTSKKKIRKVFLILRLSHMKHAVLLQALPLFKVLPAIEYKKFCITVVLDYAARFNTQLQT